MTKPSDNKGKLFGTCCNGEIEIRSITNANLEEALELLNFFFIKESVCRGTEINLNLPESLQARKELMEFCRIVSQDGVSLVGIHAPTEKVVAVAFNKIQCRPKPDEQPFFIEFNNKQCSSPNAKALMEYMITMDAKVDPFEIYGVDCLMEITFLCTHPDYERKHIGRTLCKYSIELARNIMNGVDTEMLCEDLKEKRPKIVTALFTSRFSQKIGNTLSFKVLNEVPFTEFTFKGKTFAERIGPEHPFSTQVALKL